MTLWLGAFWSRSKMLSLFWPDLIDGDGLESAEGLAREIEAEGKFFLWWD